MFGQHFRDRIAQFRHHLVLQGGEEHRLFLAMMTPIGEILDKVEFLAEKLGRHFGPGLQHLGRVRQDRKGPADDAMLFFDLVGGFHDLIIPASTVAMRNTSVFIGGSN